MINNKEIYILAGGPSLSKFNLIWFRNKDTISVNKTAMYVQNLDYFITVDHSLFKKIGVKGQRLIKNTGCRNIFIANFATGHLIEKDNTIVDKRWDLHYNLDMFDEIIRADKKEGISYNWNDFRSGDNSGYCALQYAILKGYKEINLLGVDLTVKKGKTHCHGGYGESINRFNKKLNEYYEYWKIGLEQIKRDRPDIKVYSCSEISRLNEIIPFKEIK